MLFNFINSWNFSFHEFVFMIFELIKKMVCFKETMIFLEKKWMWFLYKGGFDLSKKYLVVFKVGKTGVKST